MGLSGALSNPDVRTVIDTNYSKPAFDVEASIQAPAETDNYGLVGGAFQYVFSMWCAADIDNCVQSSVPVADAIRVASEYDAEERVKETAKTMYGQMQSAIVHGIFTAESYQAAMDAHRMKVIAHTDDEKRVRHALNDLGSYATADITDLQNLYATIPKVEFMEHDTVYTNYPLSTFDQSFPGINIDLIADSVLYDFKTTKYLRLERDEWRKLVAYVALYNAHREQTDDDLPSVDRVGVYFARHGVVWDTSTQSILESDATSKLPEFLIENNSS